MAGRKKAGAAVVRGGDERAGPWRCGGGEHGLRNFFGRAKGDGADGGTGAAQECAERARGFGGGDDLVEKRDEFLPEGLVKMIGKGARQRVVFARSKGGGDGTGVSRIFHGMKAIDARR